MDLELSQFQEELSLLVKTVMRRAQSLRMTLNRSLLMKERQMFIKKATKINPKEFSWCEIRWKMIDHGKRLNSIQKTDAVAGFQISYKPHESLSTAISEDTSLMEQFFANDSLGG